MTDRDFVHLHVHTEHSALDGASTNPALFAEVDRQGMPAVAMTDHGNLFGAYEFQQTAAEHVAKPIIGLEGYAAPSSRLSRVQEYWANDGPRSRDGAPIEGGKDVSGGGRYTHLTLLAQNARGLRNLFRLSSLASYEGYYRAPRMDRELMSRYGEGIIATTGCPSGEVQTRLRLGQYEQARQAAATYRDIFGRDNYFLEVMDHGLDIERAVRPDLLRLAKDLDLPLVATNDTHYTRREDAKTQDALLCLQTGAALHDTDRLKFHGDGYYLKSPAEMRHLFKDLPEACDNTLLIAERIEDYSDVFDHVDRMPRFPVPAEHTQDTWFRHQVHEGLRRRYPAGTPDQHRARAEHEMSIIINKGYPAYFLVVADFINWAKNHGIRVGPGRGSGAGSLCAYAMGITDLDPLEHDLIFERFLNPERPSMPDFDIDFDERRRGEVIDYVTQRYGPQYVGMVNTFGKLKSKQAVKDAATVLRHPYALGEKITKALPPDAQGRGVTLNELFDPEHPRYAEGTDVRALYEQDPHVEEIIDTARGMEGVIRQSGVHAAAIILSSEPLLDVLPMRRRDDDGALITGFDYPSCEAMGLVKMDFLGLRNLTTVEDAVRMVHTNRGITLNLEDLTQDPTDPAAYQLLARGETLGVFQLDGGGMRSLLKMMRPDRFEDISAALALYRPGPMGADSHTKYALRKTGRQHVEPIHSELEQPLSEILDPTWGLIVYQEQVQQIAQKVAGYTLGAADNLRRAMGKKKKEVLDAEYVNFEKGMLANRYSPECVHALWSVLVPFSDYAFNKAHTAAYGVIAYWTAYLKANYPAEYMAALLTSVGDNKDRLALYLNECRRLKIHVLPPDVNDSDHEFTAAGEDIRFGLAAVRNVGTNVVTQIQAARHDGPFTSFDDFVTRMPDSACNKLTIDSLIKAGAFDSLGHPRRGLTMAAEVIVNTASVEKKAAAVGQDSLFADEPATEPEIPDVEWERRTLLAYEREMLGLYVSDHPLNGMEQELARLAEGGRDVLQVLVDDALEDRARLTVAGLITSVEVKRTRKGDKMAIAIVEDLTGSMEAIFFPKTYAKVGHLVVPDVICRLTGRASIRDDVTSLAVDRVKPLDEGPSVAVAG